MGTIYYLIPDIHKKEFKIKDCLKAIVTGQGIAYFKNKVFRRHKPVGGIKVMYQHCMMLKELGYDAYPLIMGKYVGNFFGYDLKLKYIKDVGFNLNKDDVVVSPEFLPYLGLNFEDCIKVLFNQSQSWRYFANKLKENDLGKNYHELGYDYVINCSEYLREMLKSKTGDSSTAITNGIDQNKFFPLPHKRIKNRVLTLSRKNSELIDGIIKAARNLDFEFKVVDGLTEDELIDEYQKADIFMATGYPEGLPLPQLEAMNCGCVVIGFSGGGGDEYMIDNSTALVAADGDSEGILDKLKMIEYDHDFKEKVRTKGLEKAHQYNLENTSEMLNKFFQKLGREMDAKGLVVNE